MTTEYVIENAGANFARWLPQLTDLLIDSVDGGASVGFLPPLDRSAAEAWWIRAAPALEAGHRILLIARNGETVLGTVQLDLPQTPNGLHRAEVIKLLVHSTHRGKGIASALMRAIESEASALSRTLLVLDTRKGDNAERLYRALGYTAAGIIPQYALGSDGALHDTVIFYRRLN